jgi:hypothetical protein
MHTCTGKQAAERKETRLASDAVLWGNAGKTIWGPEGGKNPGGDMTD